MYLQCGHGRETMRKHTCQLTRKSEGADGQWERVVIIGLQTAVALPGCQLPGYHGHISSCGACLHYLHYTLTCCPQCSPISPPSYSRRAPPERGKCRATPLRKTVRAAAKLLGFPKASQSFPSFRGPSQLGVRQTNHIRPAHQIVRQHKTLCHRHCFFCSLPRDLIA